MTVCHARLLCQIKFNDRFPQSPVSLNRVFTSLDADKSWLFVIFMFSTKRLEKPWFRRQNGFGISAPIDKIFDIYLLNWTPIFSSLYSLSLTLHPSLSLSTYLSLLVVYKNVKYRKTNFETLKGFPAGNCVFVVLAHLFSSQTTNKEY